MKSQHLIYCIAIIAVLFTACKKDKKETSETGITLNKSELFLAIGDTATLIVTVQPDNACNKITWKSDNTTVATVNNNGLVTAITEGHTIITAATEDHEFSATCNLFVVNEIIPVTGIMLNKNEISCTSGDTETLIATVLPENATNKNVIWTSSNSNVATVSSVGVVKAVSTGKTTITATTQDGDYKDECSVTVSNDYRSQWIGKYKCVKKYPKEEFIITVVVTLKEDSLLYIVEQFHDVDVNSDVKVDNDGYFTLIHSYRAGPMINGNFYKDSIKMTCFYVSPGGASSYRYYNGKKL